jgi:putative addiction module component (TIGR02574 family)
MNMQTLEHSALHLPVHERAALAHKLLISLEDQSTADIEKAWHAEAQRRALQITHGQNSSVSSEEASAAARALLR